MGGVETKGGARVTTFAVNHPDGEQRWAFWREPYMTGVGGATSGPCWMLRDLDGYVRCLERTWVDSLPVLRRIVENYGGTCSID